MELVDKIVDEKGTIRVTIHETYVGDDLWTFLDPGAYPVFADQHSDSEDRLEYIEQVSFRYLEGIEVVCPFDITSQ